MAASRSRKKAEPKETKEAKSAEEKPKAVRHRALPADAKQVMSDFNKNYGSEVVIRGYKRPECNRISTGCAILDIALLGGWPDGYISTAFGYHSTSKTTMFLKAIANHQKKYPDKITNICDAEGNYDSDWARTLGCDT